MTGSLEIDGGELEVGGNITLAGDVIHQKDTGTRMSFNDDIITFETNGQEFVTIDGTQPTPDAVIINNPAATAIHFNIKSVATDDSFYVDGETGKVGIGISNFAGRPSMQAWVSGGLGVVGGVVIEGGVELDGAITAGGNIESAGMMLSAGSPLHDIFSTDSNIQGDLTVHGSISSQDGATVGGSVDIDGDATLTGDISASNITTLLGMHTLSGGDQHVSGITRELNIGGHIIQIVNGLIVGVIDE